MIPNTPKFLTAMLVMMLPLMCGNTVHAADSPLVTAAGSVNINASVGFSGTLRLGRWGPLTVTLENTGDVIDGALEVDVTSGDELLGTLFTTTFVRDLELTRGARKRFQFTAYIDNFSAPLKIRVVSGGSVIASQSIDLRQHVTDARITLVISRNVDLDFLINQSNERVRMIYPHPETLPEQWQAYDGVTAMVLHGVTLKHWSERQYLALEQWLNHGGVLVVSGGPDYTSLRSTQLAELLPALPVGLTVINNDVDFRATLGDSFAAPRPFQIHNTENRSGRVTLAAGSKALILEKNVGYGRVHYLTFDIGAYPFAGWSGMGPLLPRLLNLSSPETGQALPRIAQSVAPTAFEDSTRDFPQKAIVVSVVAAYLAVLAIMYRVGVRSSSINRWMHWTTPLFFLVSIGLLFMTLIAPAGVNAVAVSILRPLPNSDYARLELDAGMYTNRSDLSDLTLDSTSAVFLPAIDPNRTTPVASWTHFIAGSTRLQFKDRQPYVMHTLRGMDLVKFELQTAVSETPTGLRVDIHNQTARALAPVWLIYNGWLYPLRSVKNAEAAQQRIDHDIVVSVHNRAVLSRLAQDAGVEHQPGILRAASFIVTNEIKRASLSETEALFVGLTVPTEPVIVASSHVHSTEATLVLSRVPVVPLPRANQNSAPAGSDAR